MADTKNHMGLDKFQMTIIKGNYNNIKPILKKIEKAQAKIDQAKAKYEEAVKDTQLEVDACKTQIELLDQFTLDTTKKACGISLSSEQVMNFLNDKESFNNYKRELGGSDLFDNTQPQEAPFPTNLDAEPEETEAA